GRRSERMPDSVGPSPARGVPGPDVRQPPASTVVLRTQPVAVYQGPTGHPMKLSLASLGAEPGARFLEQVRLAELLGFHAYFHDQKRWGRGLFARRGGAPPVTARLVLGAGVIAPYARAPALIARAAAPLGGLAPGRVRLILGPGSALEALPGASRHNPVA